MFLTDFYDNTLSTMKEARETERSGILNDIPRGNEARMFQIGQTVNANGIANAIVIDVWKENGFFKYQIEHKCGRKVYKHYKNQNQLEASK